MSFLNAVLTRIFHFTDVKKNRQLEFTNYRFFLDILVSVYLKYIYFLASIPA